MSVWNCFDVSNALDVSNAQWHGLNFKKNILCQKESFRCIVSPKISINGQKHNVIHNGTHSFIHSELIHYYLSNQIKYLLKYIFPQTPGIPALDGLSKDSIWNHSQTFYINDLSVSRSDRKCKCIFIFLKQSQLIMWLTHKWLETHGSVFSIVATAALVLKHQDISTHSAGWEFTLLDQFHTNMLHLQWTKSETEIKSIKNLPSCLRVKNSPWPSGIMGKISELGWSQRTPLLPRWVAGNSLLPSRHRYCSLPLTGNCEMVTSMPLGPSMSMLLGVTMVMEEQTPATRPSQRKGRSELSHSVFSVQL